MSDVAGRLRHVAESIADIAAAGGRSDSVSLVAVTKTVPVDSIREAYDAGHHLFGENRVREASDKIELLAGTMQDARWHLIGHLQTNKARMAVRLFSVVQSVDSLRLATKLDAEAVRAGIRLPVLLEINIAGESAKSGFLIDRFRASIVELLTLPGLELRGLMTIAPLVDDPEDVRWVFRSLRELRDSVRDRFEIDGFTELSMGMTNDYEVAVKEGATIVRLGRAIFGERSK